MTYFTKLMTQFLTTSFCIWCRSPTCAAISYS